MSSQLARITVGTIKTLGFFTWGLSCAWLFQEHLYDWTSSSGPSMYPTLSYACKYNIVNKRHRLGRGLAVGDLIVAKHPNFRNIRVGKRVIGLPGDFVVRDPHMARTVGVTPIAGVAGAGAGAGAGSPQAEMGEEEEEEEEPQMIEVPPGHVWVAGDNLSWSRDSRFYGPVPMGLIWGKIVCHSNPSSDWLIDMVRPDKDQLRPARMGGGNDGEGWA